ncbi:hypothetical protein T03_17409 [Trichinella britovi]|uniref:Uncharacterized protein n=1 Tax=Trichinella britovi TaxID=45882 RepID=A0A0V0YSC9_TRIBR|nr:hypothetical protein T03_17409 [Trichinella britovi]
MVPDVKPRQICKFTVDVVLGLCFGSNPEVSVVMCL